MEIFCPDSYPNFLNFFDLSIAPHLLFYTYLPTILLSFLLGTFILIKDKRSLPSRLLFFIALFFGLWVLDIFMLWTSAYNDAIMFGWQITLILEIPIFLFSVYFTYVFTDKNNRDVSNLVKAILLIIVGLVFILLPTRENILSYDIVSCEGVLGHLWSIMYTLELIIIAWIIGICANNYHKTDRNDPFRKKIIYIAIGIVSFLVIFVLSNILGETLERQEISFFGSLGMIILLSFLTYLITKYKVFNIKLIGAQSMVAALIVSLGATLLVDDIFYSRIIIGVTLALTIGIGYYLVRSVQREIAQREKIENLAKDLERANDKLRELDQMKSEFLSLATHQIRSPLTAIKGYSSMMLDGDYGEFPVKAKGAVRTIMTSSQNLINIVGEFLDISRIEQGKMAYNKEIFDIGELVKETLDEIMPNIKKAGLEIEKKIPENFSAKTNLDKGKTKQIISNLIDNAIKYTPKGGIGISLENHGHKTIVKIKDTGIGIEEKDLDKLFTKFTRTKDAFKTNVFGTGLGLYVAKKMMEAQGGNIHVESEGLGKGSTFIIEIPRTL